MHLSMGPCDLRDIFRHIEDITALQAKNKTISITYMHDSVHHYKVSLTSGMNAHIAKPFQPADLIKTLYRYMAD